MNAKGLQVIMALAIVIQLTGTAFAQSDAISIANLAVYPQPVIAGQNVTIQFQLYNSYQTQLTQVNLGLYGSYPLLNQSPVDTQLLSNMPTGIYGGVTYFFYTLHIPKNVKSGTYTLNAIAKYQTTSQSSSVTGTSTMPISFYIQGVPNIQLTANPASAVIPGAQFTVNINALNIGTDNATAVTMAVLNSQNFSVIGASNFALGTIQPQKSSIASAILQPNSTLIQGNATILVLLSYSTQYGQPITQRVNVPVAIYVSNPNIAVSVQSTAPASLYPGSNQTIVLNVQNTGTGTAKNITISALSTRNITVGNSASNLFIASLAAGASTTVTALITANKNANLGQYSLPVQIGYQTANYRQTTNKTTYITIKLQPSAIYNITGITSSLSSSATYAPITLHITNTGNQVAQHITFSLQTIYPIAQVNPNAYINQLAAGQSANITFYVNVDSQANLGQYPITIYEQWNQPNAAQQIYTSSQTYYVSVVHSSALGPFEYILIIVLIIAAVTLYKRRMDAQHKKKAEKTEKK